jgi:hypothetical protein
MLFAQNVSPEDRLKQTHQIMLSAITTGNPAMLDAVLHRNGVGFFRDSQMIAQLGGSYGPKEAIPNVLADLSRFTVAPYDAVYRVAGSTGVVCMAMRFQPKKGEKGSPMYIRSTWTYADVDGAWRLLSWHTSNVPLKK